MPSLALPSLRRAFTLILIASIGVLGAFAAERVDAATTPSYISMENGLDPSILGPDPCTSLANTLGQCTYTHLDPASAPPLAIDREPSTTTASTPADPNAPCGGMTPSKQDGTGWTCTFSDEFSGTQLDATKWTQQLSSDGTTGGGSGSNAACFTGSGANVGVGGGELRLTVRKEAAPISCPQGGRKAPFTTRFTGGGVYSLNKFSQTYGRFEVRAAFPATVRAGLQSALWLWPNNALRYGPWPGSGEIDTAEYYTNRPGFVVPTLHYNANPLQKDTYRGINTTQNAFCHFDAPGAFHDYTVVWNPGLISVYYDGTLCLFDHYKPLTLSAPAPFDQPFFMALTAALGVSGTANAYTEGATELPATTRVDWVRAWRLGSSGSPVAPAQRALMRLTLPRAGVPMTAGGRVRLTAACPRGGPTCRGKIALVASGGRRLAHTTFALGAGHRKTVTLRLGATARRLVRRRHTVRVSVRVRGSGLTNVTKPLTLRA